jgi:hypothetical protein
LGYKITKKNNTGKNFFSKKEKITGEKLVIDNCGKKNFAVQYILRIFAIAYWNIFIIKTQ